MANNHKVIMSTDEMAAYIYTILSEHELTVGESLSSENYKLSISMKDQQLAELQPKANYYDVILQNKELLSITQIAKDYGKSGTWLNKFLADKKVQFKQSGVWFLYAKYADKGYTSSKTFIDDVEKAHMHTYWTQKGRLFIYDLLKQNGIFPLIELVDVNKTA